MPHFCRHNRLVTSCPICSREQPGVAATAPRARSPRGAVTSARPPSARRTGLRVRRVARGAEDGYANGLVPGLRSSADAARLADELAFAAGRLAALETDPPGVYAEAAAEPDRAAALELAFLIAVVGPEAAQRLAPSSTPPPAIGDHAASSPVAPARASLPASRVVARGAPDPARARASFRAWAERSGGVVAGFGGDAGWTPGRRFARLWERLALPGLGRDARYELLVLAGRLGLAELAESTLGLGGNDEVTRAAKRAFGIGDPLLLERRARALADAADVPLAALDLALFSWERGEREREGVGNGVLDPAARDRLRTALGLDEG